MSKPKQDIISKHIIETTKKYLENYVHEKEDGVKINDKMNKYE
jgi:hypothetical protein